MTTVLGEIGLWVLFGLWVATKVMIRVARVPKAQRPHIARPHFWRRWY